MIIIFRSRLCWQWSHMLPKTQLNLHKESQGPGACLPDIYFMVRKRVGEKILCAGTWVSVDHGVKERKSDMSSPDRPHSIRLSPLQAIFSTSGWNPVHSCGAGRTGNDSLVFWNVALWEEEPLRKGRVEASCSRQQKWWAEWSEGAWAGFSMGMDSPQGSCGRWKRLGSPTSPEQLLVFVDFYPFF